MNCPKMGNPAGMRGLSEAPSPSFWASTSIREPSRPSASKYVSSVSSPPRPANIMPYFPVSAVECSSLRWGATTQLCILIENLLSDIWTYYGESIQHKKPYAHWNPGYRYVVEPNYLSTRTLSRGLIYSCPPMNGRNASGIRTLP